MTDNNTYNDLLERSKKLIEELWENRQQIFNSDQKKTIDYILSLLNNGKIRVAEKKEKWYVNTWVKKAILLSFAINNSQLINSGSKILNQEYNWFDKIPLKFYNWQEEDFKTANIRAVPGSMVRHPAYIAENVVLMPCFVNVGAYIDSGTMVDTWSTIGSCAQIGKNCHISGGVGIGGVLEPLQSNPVIIEDNCFIGARSEIAEGVIVEEGAVISMGVYIGASTKIIDRTTGEIFQGRVPAYSVVVPGTLPNNNAMPNGFPSPALYCAVIVKRVDSTTRSKTAINELLRY
ncbi:2,3,4,5-tetrahydropyridine-2,6-dicarboxylate N-succinyltransferase [Rickettsiales bacterium Ac37b]|nr:2,3,4,5-tetrahydropyridine-2,6-dicarboxylate N-succinyltransferase [Rickettsiales bacterium Ac37b]